MTDSLAASSDSENPPTQITVPELIGISLKLWTEANRKRIVDALSHGATLNLAAYSAGISAATFRKWVQKGVTDFEAELETEFSKFVSEVRLAQWDVAERMLNSIDAAAPEDWRAAAWLLERRFPKDYGKQVMEITGSEAEPLQVIHRISRVEVVRAVPISADADDSSDDDAK